MYARISFSATPQSQGCGLGLGTSQAQPLNSISQSDKIVPSQRIGALLLEVGELPPLQHLVQAILVCHPGEDGLDRFGNGADRGH